MKVEFIITVECDDALPESDLCDEVADLVENNVSAAMYRLPGSWSIDSRWRKTL